MSVSIDDRITQLRKKILQAMLSIPWKIAGAIAPEQPSLGSLYGRSILAPYNRDLRVCISNESTDCPDALIADIYNPPSAPDVDLFEYLNRVQMESAIGVIPYRYEVVGGSVYYRSLQPSDARVLEFSATDASGVYAFAYPPDYPPDDWPPKLYAWGVVHSDSPEQGCDVYLVTGNVGYNSNGRLVYWSAVSLVINGYCEALIRLPCCNVGKVPARFIGAVVVGDVISANFGMVSVTVH